MVAAKAKGVYLHFKDLSELNQKESPRLKWGAINFKFDGNKNQITTKRLNKNLWKS